MPPLYRVVRPVPNRTLLLSAALFIGALIGACTTTPQQLNSERISSQFGSYHLSVLQQDDSVRISSLASAEGDRMITRTLAIVFFEPEEKTLATEAQRIREGGSIGSTFRDSGWQINKPLIYAGSLQIPDRAHLIAELMAIDLHTELALHAYRFDVSQNGETFTYATLIELHHPDYLDTATLAEIYGSTPASADDESTMALLASVRELLEELSTAPAP